MLEGAEESRGCYLPMRWIEAEPLAVGDAGHLGVLTPDHARKLPDPVRGVVSEIPHEPHYSTGPEHTMYLGESPIYIEPMKCLRDRHDVCPACRNRDGLSYPTDALHALAAANSHEHRHRWFQRQDRTSIR